MPANLHTSLRGCLFAGFAFVISLCVPARASVIDHLTLTTTANGATNITQVTYVEGQHVDADGYIPVTVDSDPNMTGRIYYYLAFGLQLGPVGSPLLEYVGYVDGAGHDYLDGTPSQNLITFTFKPGHYQLNNALVKLEDSSPFRLDSFFLDVTRDDLAVPPHFPVAPPPPPTIPSDPTATAVTPEPSSLLLLGTGLLGVGGIVRRRGQSMA